MNGFFKGLIDEIRGQDVVSLDCDFNRKASYVCKRMKVNMRQLEQKCYKVGVETLYEELRKKSGAR